MVELKSLVLGENVCVDETTTSELSDNTPVAETLLSPYLRMIGCVVNLPY